MQLPTPADVEGARPKRGARFVPPSALTAYMDTFQWLTPLMSCIFTVLVAPGHIAAADASSALYTCVRLAYAQLHAHEVATDAAQQAAQTALRGRWLSEVLVPALLARRCFRLDDVITASHALDRLLRALDAATVALTLEQLRDTRAPVHAIRAWAMRTGAAGSVIDDDLVAKFNRRAALRPGDVLTSTAAAQPPVPVWVDLEKCYDYMVPDPEARHSLYTSHEFTEAGFTARLEVGDADSTLPHPDILETYMHIDLSDDDDDSGAEPRRQLVPSVLSGATAENGAAITVTIRKCHQGWDERVGFITLTPNRRGGAHDLVAYLITNVYLAPRIAGIARQGHAPPSDVVTGSLAWLLRCVLDAVTVELQFSIALQVQTPAAIMEDAAMASQEWQALVAAGFAPFSPSSRAEHDTRRGLLTYYPRVVHGAFSTPVADASPFLPSARAMFDASCTLDNTTLLPAPTRDAADTDDDAFIPAAMARIAASAAAASTAGSGSSCAGTRRPQPFAARRQQTLEAGYLCDMGTSANTVPPRPLHSLPKPVLGVIRRMVVTPVVRAGASTSTPAPAPAPAAVDAAYVLVPLGQVLQEEAEKLASTHLLQEERLGVAVDGVVRAPVQWLCLEILAAACAELPPASLVFHHAVYTHHLATPSTIHPEAVSTVLEAMGYCLGAMFDCAALADVFVRNVCFRLSRMPRLGVTGGPRPDDDVLMQLLPTMGASAACTYAGRALLRSQWSAWPATPLWAGALRDIAKVVTAADVSFIWRTRCARGRDRAAAARLRATFELQPPDREEWLTDTLILCCRRRDGLAPADLDRLADFEDTVHWDDVLDGVISVPSSRPWAEVWIEQREARGSRGSEGGSGSGSGSSSGSSSASHSGSGSSSGSSADGGKRAAAPAPVASGRASRAAHAQIVASLQVGQRGAAADISNVAVKSPFQRQGLLARMVSLVTDTLLCHAVPVYLLAHKTAEAKYAALGFQRLLDLPQDTVYMTLPPTEPCRIEHGIVTFLGPCPDRPRVAVLDWEQMVAHATKGGREDSDGDEGRCSMRGARAAAARAGPAQRPKPDPGARAVAGMAGGRGTKRGRVVVDDDDDENDDDTDV